MIRFFLWILSLNNKLLNYYITIYLIVYLWCEFGFLFTRCRQYVTLVDFKINSINWGLSTSLFYVKQDRNVIAFGVLIGWFIRTDQSVPLVRVCFPLNEIETRARLAPLIGQLQWTNQSERRTRELSFRFRSTRAYLSPLISWIGAVWWQKTVISLNMVLKWMDCFNRLHFGIRIIGNLTFLFCDHNLFEKTPQAES